MSDKPTTKADVPKFEHKHLSGKKDKISKEEKPSGEEPTMSPEHKLVSSTGSGKQLIAGVPRTGTPFKLRGGTGNRNSYSAFQNKGLISPMHIEEEDVKKQVKEAKEGDLTKAPKATKVVDTTKNIGGEANQSGIPTSKGQVITSQADDGTTQYTMYPQAGGGSYMVSEDQVREIHTDPNVRLGGKSL